MTCFVCCQDEGLQFCDLGVVGFSEKGEFFEYELSVEGEPDDFFMDEVLFPEVGAEPQFFGSDESVCFVFGDLESERVEVFSFE